MDDTTKDIVSKERIHRTRVTVLQSTGKVNKWLLFFSSDKFFWDILPPSPSLTHAHTHTLTRSHSAISSVFFSQWRLGTRVRRVRRNRCNRRSQNQSDIHRLPPMATADTTKKGSKVKKVSACMQPDVRNLLHQNNVCCPFGTRDSAKGSKVVVYCTAKSTCLPIIIVAIPKPVGVFHTKFM